MWSFAECCPGTIDVAAGWRHQRGSTPGNLAESSGRMAKGHDVIGLDADADFLADCVIVVTRYQ
jgi:hypothetical protein